MTKPKKGTDSQVDEGVLDFVTEKCAKGLPITIWPRKATEDNSFVPGPVNQGEGSLGQSSGGQSSGEQPSQPLGTLAALSVLLAFNLVQAAKTEGRERLRASTRCLGLPCCPSREPRQLSDRRNGCE